MSNKQQVRVAIVGAGIGGISTAIALKRRLGFTNFVIYEKAEGIGGTWWYNSYPGCASDTGAHWYSLSTDLNPNWISYLANRSELLAYWEDLVNKYNVYPRTILCTSVDRAEWNDELQVYYITLRNVKTGEVWHEEAELLVCATGALSVPRFPDDIRGKEGFNGAWFHSARWRHDVPLTGKRVGVIGNGCSAAQLIPCIAKDHSTTIINFCRTPQWYLYWNITPYSSWIKSLLARVPFLLRAYRISVFLYYEILYVCFLTANRATAGAFFRWRLESHMNKTVPDKYKDIMKPKYPPGCKRIIVDPGYLQALHKVNVEVTYKGIDYIVPEGILLKSGELVPLDVIIYATGFDTENTIPKIIGRNGTSVQEYYDSVGGPTAYLGITVPGLPNFFMLMGPNTTTGNLSTIFMEEAQINYILQVMEPVINRKAQSFEVEASACDKYNTIIQQRLSKMVVPYCSSWYQSSTGKNVHVFPGPGMLYWWWTLWPRWSDYTVVGAQGFVMEHGISKTLKIAGAIIVLLLCFQYFTR